MHDLLDRRPQIAEMLSHVIAERKLRNAEMQRRLSEVHHAEEVASQFLTRMSNFINLRRRS